MQLGDYVRIARRWLLIAMFLAGAAGAGSYLLTKIALKPLYTSKVTMEVQLGLATSQSSGSIDPSYSTQFAQTEAELAGQYPNVNQALAQAELAARVHPSLSEEKTIKHNVSCSASALTALFSCSVSAHSATFAAQVANALSAVFLRSEQQWEQSRYSSVLKRISAEEKQAIQAGNRTQYDALVRLEASARQAAAQQAAIARVVAPAIPPTGPSSPHPLLNGALACALVFLLVMGGGIIADKLDDSIRGEEELKSLTRLPLLGSIPALKPLRNKQPAPGSLVVVEAPRSPAAEAFRLTRTGISFSRIDDPPRVLLVTSAVQSEGKSTVAANLAVSFAEAGKSVVFVDLDLRRPSVAKIFDVPDVGLTNLLLDERANPSSYLLPTWVPNLHVLPSGPLPPNPAELISSQRMTRVMDHLKTEADLVIVDSPPVFAVADAVTATTLCDSVVLVVRLDRVKRRMLQRVLETLGSVGATPVGLVVNSLARPAHSYYTYAYAYSSDGGKAKKKVEKRAAVATTEQEGVSSGPA